MTAPVVTITTYVAYLFPGTVFAEESIKSVDVRDPQQQANNAHVAAFAFFYYDIVTVIVDTEGDLVETASCRRNISKTYYIDAELLDYEAVRALPGDHETLLSNMRGNRWDVVALCRMGVFQPFKPAEHELLTTS